MPTVLSHEHAVAERLESGLPEQRKLGSPVSLAVQIPTLQADPKALHVNPRSPALGLLQTTGLQFGPPLLHPALCAAVQAEGCGHCSSGKPAP